MPSPNKQKHNNKNKNKTQKDTRAAAADAAEAAAAAVNRVTTEVAIEESQPSVASVRVSQQADKPTEQDDTSSTSSSSHGPTHLDTVVANMRREQHQQEQLARRQQQQTVSTRIFRVPGSVRGLPEWESIDAVPLVDTNARVNMAETDCMAVIASKPFLDARMAFEVERSWVREAICHSKHVVFYLRFGGHPVFLLKGFSADRFSKAEALANITIVSSTRIVHSPSYVQSARDAFNNFHARQSVQQPVEQPSQQQPTAEEQQQENSDNNDEDEMHSARSAEIDPVARTAEEAVPSEVLLRTAEVFDIDVVDDRIPYYLQALDAEMDEIFSFCQAAGDKEDLIKTNRVQHFFDENRNVHLYKCGVFVQADEAAVAPAEDQVATGGFDATQFRYKRSYIAGVRSAVAHLTTEEAAHISSKTRCAIMPISEICEFNDDVFRKQFTLRWGERVTAEEMFRVTAALQQVKQGTHVHVLTYGNLFVTFSDPLDHPTLGILRRVAGAGLNTKFITAAELPPIVNAWAQRRKEGANEEREQRQQQHQQRQKPGRARQARPQNECDSEAGAIRRVLQTTSSVSYNLIFALMKRLGCAFVTADDERTHAAMSFWVEWPLEDAARVAQLEESGVITVKTAAKAIDFTIAAAPSHV